MRENVYRTNDPEMLLRLKRQEAEALLDVLRSINQAHLKPEHIFKIARNALLAQCGVRKMMFTIRSDEGFRTGVRMGFRKMDDSALAELPGTLGVIPVDPEQHPRLTAYEVEWIVPVNYQNEVRAWLLVADFAETQAELKNDLIFIETIGNVVSAAVENRNLMQEMIQQESLKRELEVAETIQRQLLPNDFAEINGAEVFAENTAHHKIGGDYYDVISRGDRGFFVCIADVAGKGIGAALLMANLQANLHALILSENDLRHVIEKLHKKIYAVTQGDKFVTVFLAHVRTEEKQIDYINAGHNPPLFYHGLERKELQVGTIPLGMIDLPYLELETVDYAAGDSIFLYTDGLVEQHNLEGVMLGEEPVLARLDQLRGEGAEVVLRQMSSLYWAYAGDAVRDDDVTMMAVHFSDSE
ncbi:MAG: PP2C family protein-serine/threonine phosphatase [Bacteroidota bacterium]